MQQHCTIRCVRILSWIGAERDLKGAELSLPCLQTASDTFIITFSSFCGALVQSYMVSRAMNLFRRSWARAIFASSMAFIIAGGLLGSVLFLVLSWYQRLGKTGEASQTEAERLRASPRLTIECSAPGKPRLQRRDGTLVNL